jgi:hypothetical protein
MGASLKTELREASIMEHRTEHETCMRTAKWLANVTYNSKDGRHGVSYSFSRPEELTDLIEAAQERDRILEVEILLIEDMH